MPTQAEMKSKICPFMSPAPRALVDDMFVMCQGEACNAFNSRPTYKYLGMDGDAQLFSNKMRYFEHDDDSTELKNLLAQGWEKTHPRSPKFSLRQKAEPECWCDAMPANMECLGGGQ